MLVRVWELGPSYMLVGCELVPLMRKMVWQIFKKLNIKLPCDPTGQFLSEDEKWKHMSVQKRVHEYSERHYSD